MNMLDANSIKKNKFNTDKVESKPKHPIDHTKNNKQKNNKNDDKSNEYLKTIKTLGVSQNAYDTLETWRRIMTEGNKVPSFKDVIESLNDNVLNTMSAQKRNKFLRLKHQVDLEYKPKDKNSDFSL